MIGSRLGHSAMSARCPVCPKADTTGRFMSTRPSLTPLADLGRSAGQAPLHRLHAAGIAAGDGEWHQLQDRGDAFPRFQMSDEARKFCRYRIALTVLVRVA